MTKTIKIDIFSDPACPWCLVGLARLDVGIAGLPDDVEVEINHHPYLLDAEAPLAGEDVAEMLRRKYGRDPNEAWDRLEAEAKVTGIALDMRLQKTRYASQPAQILIGAAVGNKAQHGLAKAIGDAYYLEGKNISDAEVLVEVASGFGFAPGEVRDMVGDKARWTTIEQAAIAANQQGIQGVPFFIFNGKYALSGAQPVEMFAQALETALGDDGEDVGTR